jgi:hypothetical protein
LLLTVSGNFFWATGTAGGSEGIRILDGGGAASGSGEWMIDFFSVFTFCTNLFKN